jgi:hypothetical protein
MPYFQPFRSQLPKQVFAVHAKTNTPLSHVLTIYEVCAKIENYEERYMIYSENGIDGKAVEEYLDKVMSLNHLYYHVEVKK